MDSSLFGMIPGYVFILPMIFGAVALLAVLVLLISLIAWSVRRLNSK